MMSSHIFTLRLSGRINIRGIDYILCTYEWYTLHARCTSESSCLYQLVREQLVVCNNPTMHAARDNLWVYRVQTILSYS